MDLQDLQAFLTIADELKFTTAAVKLGTTQPSLSRRILEFEGEIGLPLFVRHGRGARLTAEGYRLVNHARDVQNSVERFLKIAHKVRLTQVKEPHGTSTEVIVRTNPRRKAHDRAPRTLKGGGLEVTKSRGKNTRVRVGCRRVRATASNQARAPFCAWTTEFEKIVRVASAHALATNRRSFRAIVSPCRAERSSVRAATSSSMTYSLRWRSKNLTMMS